LILDLHVHSVFSGDSPVTPEQYCERMAEMRQEYDLDGFVLMEHNRLVTRADCELAALSEKYGLTVLAGVEVDTYWGHVLAYGMTEAFWETLMKNGARKQEPTGFARQALAEGVLLAPSHPFRGWIGTGEMCRAMEGVRTVEVINGSDTDEENDAAGRFAEKMGWTGIGGSDAHFLGELGKGLTRFERSIKNMAELTEELKAGRCAPLRLDQAIR
jgi:predicted metal-dependent phosphoesterase TrpH